MECAGRSRCFFVLVSGTTWLVSSDGHVASVATSASFDPTPTGDHRLPREAWRFLCAHGWMMEWLAEVVLLSGTVAAVLDGAVLRCLWWSCLLQGGMHLLLRFQTVRSSRIKHHLSCCFLSCFGEARQTLLVTKSLFAKSLLVAARGKQKLILLL